MVTAKKRHKKEILEKGRVIQISRTNIEERKNINDDYYYFSFFH